MIDIEKINKAFDEYVSDYDMNNSMINLKYYHTYRVAEQSLAISKSLNLSKEDESLAYLIGILHDIGRFSQARDYGTFDDNKSIDHAELACNILFEDGLIRKFIDDDKYDDIIDKAIYYHNKYSINTLEDNERILLHSKIIRDADKIDIMYNACDLGGIKLNEDDNGISDLVREDFNLGVPIPYNHKKTKNDSVLTMLCFIFDLNFEYTYEYFRDNRFVDKMFDKLKNKKLFSEYFDKANKYVESRCNNGKRIRKEI